MPKKIEGFVPLNQDKFFGPSDKSSPIVMHEMAKHGLGHHHATLVLHDGTVERVFTESEVKEIAMNALRHVKNGHVVGVTNIGLATGSIAMAFSEYGIILDPSK